MFVLSLSVGLKTLLVSGVGVFPSNIGTINPIELIQSRSSPNPIPGSPMTVRSDIQEANSQTGVITARGNVQVYYPARKIQATSAQAQYYSKERRLVLSGNVYVLQEGNSMRAETMTYLVDEGRFIATPQQNQQVESIYIVTDNQNQPQSQPPAPAAPNGSLPPAPSLNP